MHVSISSATFDILGSVSINALPNNTDGVTRRRVGRSATLDGGASIVDGGYAEGDRDLSFTWRTVSKSHNDSVDRMIKLYALVHVSTSSGVYLAAPETFTPGVTESSITLLVKEKLSE